MAFTLVDFYIGNIRNWLSCCWSRALHYRYHYCLLVSIAYFGLIIRYNLIFQMINKWIMLLFAICFIRLTTRLWWLYHSMASFDALQSSSANTNGTIMNHFVKIWWWPLFRWFECNVRSGPLPNGFNLPLPTLCLKVGYNGELNYSL